MPHRELRTQEETELWKEKNKNKNRGNESGEETIWEMEKESEGQRKWEKISVYENCLWDKHKMFVKKITIWDAVEVDLGVYVEGECVCMYVCVYRHTCPCTGKSALD